MIGRHLFTRPGQAVEEVLGSGSQNVLPLLSEQLLPPLMVGLVIAIVLSAIMSTVDSLLVLASSAAVRDYYQKILHPEMSDEALLSTSRKATLVVAVVALALAMIVAVTTPDRTIFWFVIFGWSGISATFCPTMILSLFWKGFTSRGAMSAMIAGFVGVPIFKFGFTAAPIVGPSFEALSELPPAFLLSFIVGVLVSLLDKKAAKR